MSITPSASYKELEIPVFHDDQHGTSVVVLARRGRARDQFVPDMMALDTRRSDSGRQRRSRSRRSAR